jgi:hypothetical protein
MRFGLRKQEALALLFVIISALSTGYIFLASANYIQLFPGTSRLQLALREVGYGSSGGSDLLVVTSVDSPSGYAGFQVEYISIVMFFSNESNSLFLMNSPLSHSQYVGASLAPRANNEFSFTIPLVQQQASLFASYYTNSSGDIFANASVTATVRDFLQPVLGDIMLTNVTAISVSTD